MTKQQQIDLLIACGEALYGFRWQTDLADTLAADVRVSDRTVRRWVAGDSPIPSGLWTDLMRMMQERAATFDGLAERCKEAGAPQC
jgi:hypothetical protein